MSLFCVVVTGSDTANDCIVYRINLLLAIQFSICAACVELTVISACVVGGISVMGGVGTVVGCTLGALLIGLIRNALPAVDISQFWQLAISGAIILIAIIINTKTEQRKDKTIMVE